MMSVGMGVFLNAVSAPGGGIPGFSPALAGAVAEWEEGLIADGHGGAYAYVDSEGGVSVTLDPGSLAHDVCAADPTRCINQGIRMDFVHVDTGVTLEWGTRAAAYEIRGPQQACMILGRIPPVVDPFVAGGRAPIRLAPNQTFNEGLRPVRATPPRPLRPALDPAPSIEPILQQQVPRMPFWYRWFVAPWFNGWGGGPVQESEPKADWCAYGCA